MNLLQIIVNSVLDDFGYPASIKAALANGGNHQLSAPAPTIALRSVPNWQDWRQFTTFIYGTGDDGDYILDLMGSLVTRQVIDTWTCDITDVQGLGAAKSTLENYSTMDEFAESRCADFIHPMTEGQLRTSLAHDQVRITRETGGDYFVQHSWDGRIFLANQGGAHHFAAARYIASRLGTPVPLRSRLIQYGIDPAIVACLRYGYEIFAVPSDHEWRDRCVRALRNMDAKHQFTQMPSHYPDHKALFLPRSSGRSMRVAKMMREAGLTDLGHHLAELAHVPRYHPSSYRSAWDTSTKHRERSVVRIDRAAGMVRPAYHSVNQLPAREVSAL